MIERQVALVTGASSGIGRETALGLARMGYEVIAAARRLERLEELAVRQPGIVPRRVDLAEPGQVEEFAAWLVERAQPVAVLVNNAGYALRGAVEEVPPADARRLYEVNLFAPIRLIQACLPGMRRLGHGRIVNLSSLSGRVVLPGNATYSSSKFALEGYSEGLRLELLETGIKVVVVRPGPVDTEFVAVATAMTGERMQQPRPEYQKVYQRLAALLLDLFAGQGSNTPGEVAEVILEAVSASDPAPSYAVGPIAAEFLALRDRLDDAQLLEHFRRVMGISD